MKDLNNNNMISTRERQDKVFSLTCLLIQQSGDDVAKCYSEAVKVVEQIYGKQGVEELTVEPKHYECPNCGRLETRCECDEIKYQMEELERNIAILTLLANKTQDGSTKTALLFAIALMKTSLRKDWPKDPFED